MGRGAAVCRPAQPHSLRRERLQRLADRHRCAAPIAEASLLRHNSDMSTAVLPPPATSGASGPLRAAALASAAVGIGALAALARLDVSPNPLFHPHGYCFLWEPGLVGAHVISDGLIGLSYLAISL